MRLVILDRDGVINEDSDEYIKCPAEWIPIPHSLEAIVRLNQAGYQIIVATNQSGIGRGFFDVPSLNRIHSKMHHLLAQMGGGIEAILFCPHAPEEDCSCRKPRPGLFHDLARRLRIQLKGVPVVGDSLRDLQAAQAVGATPLLVRTGKGRRTAENPDLPMGVEIYDDLASVADALLKYG
ncbi:D-glycero-beta-D-manno-heptose 1,7-bisphosphate 7-phosphatase [Nitrosococcus watsonii]|uniref:D,D-heptose 1,7-bisphosphate phosphatase n=1 Tax=Nitrosococcus watsoni (strain C-113) TaxID=105559 RepID=D8KAR8_NITWC|nr:D-glycero-beta-D-manno-heptose 1,7-bisphosphate 7-phosphatase [Nitrosococcus watsonii]ADJ29495.1 histidinol-phosphate phosphatase family protein [Nitrosococcus watsonii C-113]